MPVTIPPLMHFIWAGGDKLLPDDGIDNITDWIVKNKDIDNLQSFLWIDELETIIFSLN